MFHLIWVSIMEAILMLNLESEKAKKPYKAEYDWVSTLMKMSG